MISEITNDPAQQTQRQQRLGNVALGSFSSLFVVGWVLTLSCMMVLTGSAQSPEPSPTQTASPSSVPTADATPEPSQPPESVVDQIERLLRERENAESTNSSQLPPDRPRSHRFTNQPIAKVLRILAEQAGVNYVEPNMPPDERISVSLNNLTPLQAFYEIAESRGFRIITDGERYTLRRSDIESPSFYITRRYRIRNQPAELLLQPIANYLGVKVTPAQNNFPVYPKAENTTIAPDALGIGGTGSDQSRPRYEPGLPFDAPLSVGGYEKNGQTAVFVERSSNSLVVRATPEAHDMIRVELERLDRPEQQILIKTYVVEVTDTNSIGGGLDWSQTLGLQPGQGAKFSLTGQAGIPPASNLQTVTGAINAHGGGFFSNGLVLNLSDVQVVLQALKTKGRVRTNNSPMTVAKSGVPVTIRSDTKQTIFLQTSGTQVYGPSTVPYTFTTGLTIDIVARILDAGIVDLNLNPTLSTIAGTSAAQPGTTTQIPVISTRSTTADVTVRSGQAAVIGGILQDSATFTASAVPGLSKIPVVGYLFKSKATTKQRTNLIVIVSPTIIPAASRTHDRLGESEQRTLEDSSDLPGEPPPIPSGRSGKQNPRMESDDDP
jgi:type II secretory pathway component GspD/PulD (secretin)